MRAGSSTARVPTVRGVTIAPGPYVGLRVGLGVGGGRQTSGPMPEAPTDVWIAPYLRLRERVRVARWEVIPADELELADCVSQHALDQVNGLLKLYRRPRRVRGEGLGSLFRHGRERVGESYQRRDIGTLHRALLVGLLDSNQTPWRGPLNDPNWGWGTSTSDSVFLVGHRIDPDGYVSAQYGWMITTLEAGLTIKDDPELTHLPSEIAPPAEQPFPMRAAAPDQEYVNELFKLLAAGDERAARLAGAIDWLDLAWRNTTSVNEGTRILMLKAGFEALLGASYTLPQQRSALATLLGAEAGRRRWQTPLDQFGRPKPRKQMTDVEWWFTRFTWLRNAIAHGRASGRDWVHGHVRHYWLADHWLRAAIRAEVAAVTGLAYLRELDPMQRAMLRFLHENPEAFT